MPRTSPNVSELPAGMPPTRRPPLLPTPTLPKTLQREQPANSKELSVRILCLDSGQGPPLALQLRRLLGFSVVVDHVAPADRCEVAVYENPVSEVHVNLQPERLPKGRIHADRCQINRVLPHLLRSQHKGNPPRGCRSPSPHFVDIKRNNPWRQLHPTLGQPKRTLPQCVLNPRVFFGKFYHRKLLRLHRSLAMGRDNGGHPLGRAGGLRWWFPPGSHRHSRLDRAFSLPVFSFRCRRKSPRVKDRTVDAQ
ncbi:hypothetical protein MRX96_016662 [Rhipicephalus microplus]